VVVVGRCLRADQKEGEEGERKWYLTRDLVGMLRSIRVGDVEVREGEKAVAKRAHQPLNLIAPFRDRVQKEKKKRGCISPAPSFSLLR